MTPILSSQDGHVQRTPAILGFERAIRSIVAPEDAASGAGFSPDADAYAAAFAPEGVIVWPFAAGAMARRVQGREQIALHVGRNLARARAAGRVLTGPYDVVLHPVGDDRLVVEFSITVGPGSPHLPYVQVYRVDGEGRIIELRDYFGATTQAMADSARIAERRERACAVYAAIDARDWSRVAPHLHADLEVHHGARPAFGAAAWRDALEEVQTAFPDAHHVIDEVLVDGESVVTRGRFVGTRRAPFRGIAPTGASVEASVVHIDRFEDGLLRRHFVLLDGEALLR